MKRLMIILLIVTTVSCSSAKKNLVGYWYKPKTMINVRFFPDRTFDYNDYDSAANRSQKMSGKYRLEDNIVTLEFNDKSKQVLDFKRSATNNNYYLKQGEIYFIKDDRVNNAVPQPR